LAQPDQLPRVLIGDKLGLCGALVVDGHGERGGALVPSRATFDPGSSIKSPAGISSASQRRAASTSRWKHAAALTTQSGSSRFVGFDNHEPSILRARRAAEQASVSDRVTFEVADAKTYPAPLSGFDLIAFFDCLHELGDPVAVLRHAASTVAEDGTVLDVEPMAGAGIEDNFNPVGRMNAGMSVLICTPHGASEGSTALGTIASDSALRK
jgi:SAM-dependent methyltransferase